MPQLTVDPTRSRGFRTVGEADPARKWMASQQGEQGRVVRTKRQLSTSQPTSSWSQTLRTLRRGCYSCAPVGVMWSVCQVEAPLHPSLFLLEVFWRLLLVCLLWMVLAGCVQALKRRLWPEQTQGAAPLRMQLEVIAKNQNHHYLWMSQSRSPGLHVPLARALADSLLLCVLHESLPDPSGPHRKALLSRLGSVCHTLGKADVGSEVTLKEVDGDSILMDKVKLIHIYLQQRVSSLSRLVQVQEDFEAGVKDMLEGLEGLWAQLEELHTGVTLTKEGSRGHADLASAQTNTESLFAVLGHYRNKLQCCQAHLKDSTQLLQELTWSHTHISNSVRSSSESVWPELLLQSNIEQFDKVQESFFSLEQQTSTFQAHLEGLGKDNEEGHAGPLAHANGARSRSVSPQTSLHHVEDCDSASMSTSVSSMEVDPDPEIDGPLTLCERSAVHFTATIGRLRKSGRKK